MQSLVIYLFFNLNIFICLILLSKKTIIFFLFFKKKIYKKNLNRKYIKEL